MELKSNLKPEDVLAFEAFNDPALARLHAAPEQTLAGLARARLEGALFIVGDDGAIREEEVMHAELLTVLETTPSIRRYLASLVDGKGGRYRLPGSFFTGPRQGNGEQPAPRPKRETYPYEPDFVRAEAAWFRQEQQRKARIEAARAVR